jgi:hypothetical protein
LFEISVKKEVTIQRKNSKESREKENFYQIHLNISMKINESVTSTATIVPQTLKHSINRESHNQHSNDTISICSSQTTATTTSSSTTSKAKPVKILKAFYKKDASASVNKSFDNNYNNFVHIYNNQSIRT